MFKHASRKSRRLVWLLLAILSSGSYAYACLQGEESPPVRKGVEVEGASASDFTRRLVTHEDRAYWERARAAGEKLGREHPSPAGRNDLAVALIHLGQLREAVSILEERERKSPGAYATAANLGTAYELAGDNLKALGWIKEGVRRNGDSHYGTEWLHVKILEAKLALEKEPHWLTKNTVLGADLRAPEDAGRPESPVTDHLGRPKSLAEVEAALVYQLHERLEFVRPPDPVVADLLFDLSNLLARTRSAEHARAVRGLAIGYNPGHVKSRLAARPDAAAETRPASNDSEGPYLLFGSLACATLLLAGGLYAFVRK